MAIGQEEFRAGVSPEILPWNADSGKNATGDETATRSTGSSKSNTEEGLKVRKRGRKEPGETAIRLELEQMMVAGHRIPGLSNGRTQVPLLAAGQVAYTG